MLAFGLIAVALLAVTAEVVAEPQGPYPTVMGYRDGSRCPADLFYNHCNFCRCAKDGYSASCTEKQCFLGPMKPMLRTLPESKEVEVVYAPNYKHGDKCPGKYFNDGCNDCTCMDDGVTAICTLVECLP